MDNFRYRILGWLASEVNTLDVFRPWVKSSIYLFIRGEWRMTNLYFGVKESFDISEFQDRKVIDEIAMVMSAFDCVLPDDAGIYCSSDVTTGRRFYFEYLRSHGARSDEELKEKMGGQRHKELKTELIRTNVSRSLEFTEKLRERGLVNLVNPGPFFAPGFDQQHYLYLWEWVIIKKIYEIYFNEGWQYSDGCTLEFAIATKKGIPRLNHHGAQLSLAEATSLIERAVFDLKQQSFLVTGLDRNLALLRGLQS